MLNQLAKGGGDHGTLKKKKKKNLQGKFHILPLLSPRLGFMSLNGDRMEENETIDLLEKIKKHIKVTVCETVSLKPTSQVSHRICSSDSDC